MVGRIDDFRAAVSQNGLSRNNRFVLRVFPPRGLTSLGFGLNTIFGRVAGNVNIPGLSSVNDISIPGINIPVGDLNIGANLNLPPLGYFIQNIGGRLTQMELFCVTASIPSRDVQSVNDDYHGATRKIGWKHLYADFTTEYYCSEDLKERDFFEGWQNIIFNRDTGSVGYYEDYASTVELLKYDYGFNRIQARYKFLEAYPTNVGEQAFSYDGTDEITRLTITWAFRQYERG